MSPIDRIAHANRWRGRSLTEKAVLALGLLTLTVSLPPFPASAPAFAVMTTATLAGARVPVRAWVAGMAAPTGFLVAGALTFLIRVDADGVSYHPQGLVLAGELALRSLAGVSCLLFLALTTPATDLVAGSRRLGVPPEITEVALLIYRFVFLFAETAQAMNAAQAARLGHVDARRRLTSLGVLIASLLPRSLDRARRLEIGLAARGWNGEFRVLGDRRPISPLGITLALTADLSVLLVGVCAS